MISAAVRVDQRGRRRERRRWDLEGSQASSAVTDLAGAAAGALGLALAAGGFATGLRFVGPAFFLVVPTCQERTGGHFRSGSFNLQR